MTGRARLTGFYAVLDRDSETLARTLVDPKAGGARVLQLRIKPDTPLTSPPPARELLRIGQMAARVAREHGALLVVNDRLDLALALGADGVHLGQDDLPLADARAVLGRLGRELLVGISTHDDDQVRQAVAGGADYIGYGPVYPTATKQNPDPVRGLERLARAVALAGEVPVVAIGGVTPARAPELAAAGAAMACAISAVNGAADVAAAGAEIAAAFG